MAMTNGISDFDSIPEAVEAFGNMPFNQTSNDLL